MSRRRRSEPQRKRVWNTDPYMKAFTQYDSKGRAVKYRAVGAGESVRLPVHQADRLLADGGWTEDDPNAARSTKQFVGDIVLPIEAASDAPTEESTEEAG